MAVAAVQTAMTLEGGKSVHPFFSKPQTNTSHESPAIVAGQPTTSKDNQDQELPTTATQAAQPPKKRTRKAEGAIESKKRGEEAVQQSSLHSFVQDRGVDRNGNATGVSSNDQPQVVEEPFLEEDPNHGRKKRRKTASPGPPNDGEAVPQPATTWDWHRQLQVEAHKSGDSPMMQDADTSAFKPVGVPSDLGSTVEGGEAAAPAKTTPKKILKVNKNGKLLSPGSAKPSAEPTASPKRKRRRQTKTKQSPTITIIKYGTDGEGRRTLGKKIDDILNSVKPAVKHSKVTKKAPGKPTKPQKSTHPFFLGKPQLPQDNLASSKSVPTAPVQAPHRSPRKSAVTPGKLRAESRGHHFSLPMPAFGPIAGDSRAPKYPGMSDAPWPSKTFAHVRSIATNDFPDLPLTLDTNALHHGRKLKSSIPTITPEEDLIRSLAQQLNHSQVTTEFNLANCSRQPEHVRLPGRLLTTGSNIQNCARSEVRNSLDHPALKPLFDDIAHTLTPFDKGECEQQSWVQKYAPGCASRVLQEGKEAYVLRDWLRNLTIMAVESGKGGKRFVDLSDPRKPPKKKRKKVEIDFIVPDFEEDIEGELVEVSDEEGKATANNGLPRLKSLKCQRMSRNNNVIVVSGPSGCGKSAMIYAVAKELGFEVFEINSGSRRSGKDIQDKVGDMTANHLVNHKREQLQAMPEVAPADDTDNERMSTALQKDLDSGRQGTMTSFFTAKPQPDAKVKMPKAARESRIETVVQATLQPQATQKQSLILFEEADIVFEEDQQFWVQIIKLAYQSKRPIILTCNSEAHIPLYDLPLGAILRLSPPSCDLASDYMITLAAREGHVLERNAVLDLYKSKNHDLRASITELDFWCQMSVGDRKGGLEWMYQRWPPGKDVNENGEVLRVASKGTYQSGMGWLSRDIFAATDNSCFDKHEELLEETWTNWGLTPAWIITKRIENEQEPSSSKTTTTLLDNLTELDLYHDSISAADVYCGIGLPTYDEKWDEPIDSTLPPLREKERLSHTIDARILQCDQVTDFSGFDTIMSIQSWLAVRAACKSDWLSNDSLPLTESDLNKAILEHQDYSTQPKRLTRPDFSSAFDILAYPPTASLSVSSYQMTPSSFDRTFKIVVEDLAPYVRSIVSHELRVETARVRISNLLSEGGGGKRPRTTRASRTALEGGTREAKRRERWFDSDVSFPLVMSTAGQTWSGLGSLGDESETDSRTGTMDSLPSTQE